MQDQDRDQDNFGKYYSDEASRIHAPKDLVERTRAAMKAEASMPVQSEDKSDKMLEDETRKKRKNLRIWIPSLAAASLCIVILGAYGGYRH